MKKALSVILALALMLTFVACSSQAPPATEDKPDKGAAALDDKPTKEPPASTVDTPATSGERADLVIKDSGWSSYEGYSSKQLSYAVVIENPNTEYVASFFVLRVTAKDEAGTVVASQEEYLSTIYPGETTAYASDYTELRGGDAATVTFELLVEDYNWQKIDKNDAAAFKPLTIQNDNEVTDQYYTTFTGEVANNNTFTVSNGYVYVVFKSADGKIVGGTMGMFNTAPSNGTASFEVLHQTDSVAYESVDLYAMIGSIQ